MQPIQVVELNWDSRHVAQPLFSHATFDRVHIDAVFEGRQPGQLFVDNPANPTSALLCRTYDYFLAGEPSEALVRFLEESPAEARVFDTIHDLAAARLQQTTAFYGLVPITNGWHAWLSTAFDGQLEVIGRRAFRIDPIEAKNTPSSNGGIPADVELRSLDAELARRVDTEAGELIGLFWGGYERFSDHGFGSVAFVDGEIAAVCYTIATSARDANFGVETVERFRRRGLATLVARACIAEAIERGLTPTWDCDEPNPASALLAIKVGFEEQPSFVEFAFPDRRGPQVSSGLWTPGATSTGTTWSRNSG